jgi:hypothetical protein
LAALCAEIGIAVSGLFPHFSLAGDIGLAAENFPDLAAENFPDQGKIEKLLSWSFRLVERWEVSIIVGLYPHYRANGYYTAAFRRCSYTGIAASGKIQ